jgi:hypothetical protein
VLESKGIGSVLLEGVFHLDDGGFGHGVEGVNVCYELLLIVIIILKRNGVWLNFASLKGR